MKNSNVFTYVFQFFVFCSLFYLNVCNEIENSNSKEWYKIEGKVQAPDSWARSNGDWRLKTDILIDGGEYRAFIK